MKSNTLILLLSVCLFACGSKSKSEEITLIDVQDSSKIVVKYPAFNFDTLVGNYHGRFGDKELHLNISHVSEFNAVGYNVVNGLVRNVSGKVSQSADSICIRLSEMGDHLYDGTFVIQFNRQNLSNVGYWMPNDAKLGNKNFVLKRKAPLDYNEDFDYDKKVTEDNFLRFFNNASDSLGDYNFDVDGTVEYTYYASAEEYQNQSSIPNVAKGSWIYKNGVLTINWLPNFAFPKLKSTFKLSDKRKDDLELTLVGEGRIVFAGYEGFF